MPEPTSKTRCPALSPRNRRLLLAILLLALAPLRPLSAAVLLYQTQFGGAVGFPSPMDVAYGIAVDGSGAAYVTGETESLDFPTVGPFQSARGGQTDVFVTKLDPSGTSLVYSSYLGGSGVEPGDRRNGRDNLNQRAAIAVDSAGRAYVTGTTTSLDFPLMAPLQGTCRGVDAFVSVLDVSGSALVYSTYLGGALVDHGTGIAVDASGAIYVIGETDSPDFPLHSPLQPMLLGGWDAFVTKLTPSGSALVFSTFLGGSDVDAGRSIALDANGAVYVTGETRSPNFPTVSAFQPAYAGGVRDAFVSKFAPSGSTLVYSTYLGGTGQEDLEPGGICVGPGGEAFIAGSTFSADFPTANPFQATNGGLANVFVTELAATGSSLVFSTYLGGGLLDRALGLGLNASGAATVAGGAISGDFPTLPPSLGNRSGFVARFAPGGASLRYSTHLGFSAEAIAVDVAGAAYVTGSTGIGNFDDVFVAKIGNPGSPPTCDAGPDVAAGCDGVTLSATASDPDNDPLTFLWTSSCPGTTFSPSATVLNPTVTLASTCNASCTLTLTVTDDDGSCTSSLVFAVNDVTPPSLTGVPPNATVACDAVPASAPVAASDGCDPGPLVVTSSDVVTPGSCPDSYTIARTYAATDRCGNLATAVQTITVRDTTPPVLANVPTSVTVECDAVPPPSTAVTASDNCTPASIAVTSSDSVTPGACPDSYTIARTYAAADRCGNVASALQLITVRDTTPPVLLGVPPGVTVECDAVPPPAAVTTNDTCDPAPALTFAEIRIDGSCPSDYTLVRTWTATDRCGNVASATQQVSVRDTTPPVVQSTQDQLACLWPANHKYVCFARTDFPVVASDNCSDPVTWRLAGCVSDQCDDAPCRVHPGENGDGSTHDDCVVSADGEQVCVRAERAGSEPAGRHYTLTSAAEDDCRNVSTPTVIGTIFVPHDGGSSRGCVRP